MSTTETDDVQLEKIQRRIESLLERASHSATPPEERQTCLDTANRLAFKYRIDVSMRKRDEKQAREPEWREYKIDYSLEYSLYRSDMQTAVFRFYGAKVSNQQSYLHVLGFHDDLVLAEMMWTNIFLHFVKTVIPEWDKHRTFDHNVYSIKNSGRSWAQIVQIAPEEYNLTMSSGARLRRAYAAEAKRQGTPVAPQPREPKRWRESFAESYTSTIVRRLMDMEWEAKEADKKETGGEGMLALRKDHDVVAEEFYQKFPHLRPWTKEQHEAYRAKRKHEEQVEAAAYAAMTPGQQRRYDERKERERAKQERENARWEARNRRDPRGWEAGHKSALKADLGTDARVAAEDRQALG